MICKLTLKGASGKFGVPSYFDQHLYFKPEVILFAMYVEDVANTTVVTGTIIFMVNISALGITIIIVDQN